MHAQLGWNQEIDLAIAECSQVHREEERGQGWLVKTRMIYCVRYNIKQFAHSAPLLLFNSHGCLRYHSLCSFRLSPFAQSTRPSLHSVSLYLLSILRWFLSGLSTPITGIRHRCSSFCTWPTYSPLSAKSLSRCRLRWNTHPSPHRVFHFFTFKNSWVVSAVCFGSLSTCTVGSLSTCTEEAVKQQKRTAVCKCFVCFLIRLKLGCHC